MKQAEEHWLNEQCEIIDSELSKNDSETAFETFRNFTKLKQPRLQ